MISSDISEDFRPNKRDSQMIQRILVHEGTPEAIRVFARYAYRFSDYAYWFVLGTLWVSYTGWSDLAEWKRLFAATRPGRETGLMKPSELAVYRRLPEPLLVYRAHRPGEQEWISYTLSPETAGLFARNRDVDQVMAYLVRRRQAIVALFLRRGEYEVLVLHHHEVEPVREVPVVVVSSGRSL
jgi:hypothetical protein